MDNLSVAEAISMKKELQTKILNLVHEFQKATKTKVVSLSVITKYMNDGGDEKLWGVEVKAEI